MDVRLIMDLSAPFIFALIILISAFFSNAYAQGKSSPTEELIHAGPVQFSTTVDISMLITAAAFVSTILYNFWQMKKAEENLIREMNERETDRKQEEEKLKKETEQRDTEIKQQMLAQQEQIKANQEQMQNDKKISEAGFWLTLREFISRYDDISSSFSPGGRWGYSTLQRGPHTRDEWTRVESYMMLLQQLNIMIDKGVLSQEIFDRLYGFKIDSIYFNPIVRIEKLVLEGWLWREFSLLCLKRNLHRSDTSFPWPKFWVGIAFADDRVVVGDLQAISISVYDSLESLKEDGFSSIPDASVKVVANYPSSKTKTLEDITDKNGTCTFYLDIEKDSLIAPKKDTTSEVKIIITVSKDDKELSGLTKSFKISL